MRNLVWDAAHGYDSDAGAADIDLLYFDPASPIGHEAMLLQQLQASLPGLAWDVVNQALVHRWYASWAGEALPPAGSLAEAMARWPETATAVGVWLDEADGLQLLAPLGLADLFALQLRHNRAGVSRRQFEQRLLDKDFLQRWPQLRVLAD